MGSRYQYFVIHFGSVNSDLWTYRTYKITRGDIFWTIGMGSDESGPMNELSDSTAEIVADDFVDLADILDV